MESSTTSAKAMVYDTRNGSLQTAEEPYDKTKSDDGIQDPDDIFNKTLALAGELCRGNKIGLIVLSGTFHSLILCGLDMKPKTPSFLWSYTGAKELCANLRRDTGYVKHFYKKTGCMVHSIYPFFKIKYLESQGQDIKNRYIMEQGSYNFYRLTGERRVMDSMASGSGMFNINTLDYDSELLTELGINREQLPELVKWSETGALTPEAARLLGVQAGIPVMSAGPDGGLNQIGSEAIHGGIMTLSVGTSAAMRMSASEPRLSCDNSTWCYLSPKKWLSGAAVSGGCNCVDWIKRLMFPADSSYLDCEKEIRTNEGKAPIFFPFLYGERCPGWNDERQASFLGVLPQHTAYDFYYSVLEGVLFNIRQCYNKLCELNGQPAVIKISGGILNSPLWLQMCADILGKTLTVDAMKHSSMVGGLMLGIELIGQKPHIRKNKANTIFPQNEMHKNYLERFETYEKHYMRG